jgi:hypothetical protein
MFIPDVVSSKEVGDDLFDKYVELAKNSKGELNHNVKTVINDKKTKKYFIGLCKKYLFSEIKKYNQKIFIDNNYFDQMKKNYPSGYIHKKYFFVAQGDGFFAKKDEIYVGCMAKNN